jgi:hypothetical protein
MNLRMLALLACSASLSACGGGDGGQSGSPVVTPSPTPTPGPSPTPSPSYPAYGELTGDQSFQAACQTTGQGSGAFILLNPTPFYADPGVTLDYDASESTYRLTAYGIDESFGPADVDDTIANAEKAYRRTGTDGFTTRMILFAPQPGGSTADYTRVLYAFARNTMTGYVETYNCIFGVPTLLTDQPSQTQVSFTDFSTGGNAYRLFPDNTVALYRLTGSAESLSVNLTTGAVNLSVRVTGQLQSVFGTGTAVPSTYDFGTFTGETSLDDETRGFGGILNYQNPTLFAPYEGWFFGPQGAEAGLTVGLSDQDQDGVRTIGQFTIVGAR